jgi:hypothetical protein
MDTTGKFNKHIPVKKQLKVLYKASQSLYDQTKELLLVVLEQ